MRKLIIFAPNVGTGGGLVLLRELLYAGRSDIELVAIISSRGQGQIDPSKAKGQIIWAEHSVSGRLRAECALRQLTDPGDTVLCFHNLPPLFLKEAQIVCYLHNPFVISDISLGHRFSWIRIRIGLERIISTLFKRKVTRYAVQTGLMRERLAKWFGDSPPPIDVYPFAPSAMTLSELTASSEDNEPKSLGSDKRWDFFYPSDGSDHKNHLRLFAAWRLLSDIGHYPSLAVTLDREKDVLLLDALKEMFGDNKSHIVNLGKLNYREVAEQYKNSKSLIFPSFEESFGLPLIEAAHFEIPIIAPELDYVREVCEPSQTFNPYSSRSIAMAVMRHQGVSFSRQVPTSAFEFLGSICQIKHAI